MDIMESLKTHYKRLLGLENSWQVETVDLQRDERRVVIHLKHRGGRVKCPECKKLCSIADHGPERSWRHLDTMQFETRLVARIPRSNCPDCGVKTIAVPWSSPHARFTLMFEAFAIEVLQACDTVQSACALVDVSWHSMDKIMKRAVERGLDGRELETIDNIGIDEKSFRKGHSYISALNDLDKGRVLEVVEGRSEESADRLWNVFNQHQLDSVQAVAMDMWPAYINTANNHVPNAEVVHDRYHISAHLNKSVDRVRRHEHKMLQKEDNNALTGTKQLWLFNSENLPKERQHAFKSLKDSDLKTARGWAIKENFRNFWGYTYTGSAKRFFDQWYYWATHSRLKPMVEVAKMLKRHLGNILTWFKHPISNAISEGFNSRIQSIKANARGFRSFENYRVRILFFCGKLDLYPNLTAH